MPTTYLACVFFFQFEQTLLVTESGCDILTKRNTGRPWFLDQLEKIEAKDKS